jgi:hypothetical protein
MRSFDSEANQVTLICSHCASLKQCDEIESIISTVKPYLVVGKNTTVPLQQNDCGHKGTCVLDTPAFQSLLMDAVEKRDILRTSDLYSVWIKLTQKDI